MSTPLFWNREPSAGRVAIVVAPKGEFNKVVSLTVTAGVSSTVAPLTAVYASSFAVIGRTTLMVTVAVLDSMVASALSATT